MLWGLKLPGNQDEVDRKRKASDTDRGIPIRRHLIMPHQIGTVPREAGQRLKSPQMQKVPVFKGSDSSNWKSFIYQFERVAAHRRWSANKKTFRLLDCLGDVTLEYIRKVNKNGDYKDLKRRL